MIWYNRKYGFHVVKICSLCFFFCSMFRHLQKNIFKLFRTKKKYEIKNPHSSFQLVFQLKLFIISYTNEDFDFHVFIFIAIHRHTPYPFPCMYQQKKNAFVSQIFKCRKHISHFDVLLFHISFTHTHEILNMEFSAFTLKYTTST